MNRLFFCLAVGGLFLVGVPVHAHAQIREDVVRPQLDASAVETGISANTDPRLYLAGIIQILLSLLGTLFILLLLQAGYWFFIARGRSEYIEKARKTMLRAVIGLMITLGAYSITTFVKNGLNQISDENYTSLRRR